MHRALGAEAQGSSFHFAPLSKLQKVPRMTLLLSTGGRPLRGLLEASGIRSANHRNCSSVNFNAMHNHATHTDNDFRIGSMLEATTHTTQEDVALRADSAEIDVGSAIDAMNSVV